MITVKELEDKKTAVAVIGMGYVGLPLAVELGKKLKVIGFDINAGRVEMLRNHQDPSKELSPEALKATQVFYTANPEELKKARFIIIAVPTPIDGASNPNLTPVRMACATVGQHLQKGSVVVLESTVYPGVTEEIMGPELEKHSGLKRGVDFKLGYSPERINPGDTEHTLTKIVKVVSGEDEETLNLVAGVYSLVVEPGVHRASTIKVAEAAKVIENTQRDLNIALMNELSIIFDKLGIDSLEVLKAAGTKWNFLKFFPGLVGGHCIGVDPYYLTHKAKEMGYNAEIILAGRRINDSMGPHVAHMTVKAIIKNGSLVNGARVLVLGLSFKENVADIRNTKVVDIVSELRTYGVEVLISDPLASSEEAKEEYGLTLTDFAGINGLDAVILASPHEEYLSLNPSTVKSLHREASKAIFFDVKRALPRKVFEEGGVTYLGL